MPSNDTPRRTPTAGRIPATQRFVLGGAAGLVGGAVVALAGKVVERAGWPQQPTLPAQLVAKSVRLPRTSRRHQSTARHTAATATGMQTALGPDMARVERIGQIAHYAWSGVWGGVRGLLGTPRFSRFSAGLIHALGIAATDHILLASTNVGAPIWGHHDQSTDSATQAGQLLLYSLVTSLTYQQLTSTSTHGRATSKRIP